MIGHAHQRGGAACLDPLADEEWLKLGHDRRGRGVAEAGAQAEEPYTSFPQQVQPGWKVAIPVSLFSGRWRGRMPYPEPCSRQCNCQHEQRFGHITRTPAVTRDDRKEDRRQNRAGERQPAARDRERNTARTDEGLADNARTGEPARGQANDTGKDAEHVEQRQGAVH